MVDVIEEKVKSPEEIAKFRAEVVKGLETATGENVFWLQGCIYGLDYRTKEEKKEDGFTE
jgi:hypothetical protein